MASFDSELAAGRDAINELKGYRRLAVDLSPSLVPTLDAELAAKKSALDKAIAAVDLYDSEDNARVRAEAEANAAAALLASSDEIDPKAVKGLIDQAAVTARIASTRRRRVEAARNTVVSAIGRCTKEIGPRKTSAAYARKFASSVLGGGGGQLIDEATSKPLPLPDAATIAHLRIALPTEGRDFYGLIALERERNPRAIHTYGAARPVEDYDRDVRHFFGSVDAERERAARRAAELDTAPAAVAAAE